MKVKYKGVLIIALFPLLINLYLLLILPGEVPIHFDAAGLADRMGSKFQTLLIPLLTGVVNIPFVAAASMLGKHTESPGMKRFWSWYPVWMACIFSAVAVYLLLLIAGSCI